MSQNLNVLGNIYFAAMIAGIFMLSGIKITMLKLNHKELR